MSKTILITGATGKQGGATLRALAGSNTDYNLLAVTRNTTSPSALNLTTRHPSVKLIQGDLNDPEALLRAAEDATPSHQIWGIFSVQLPEFNKHGLAIEEKQGKGLIDAAIAHGVQHFVYSSVDRGGAEVSDHTPTNVPHFASKHAIEKHLIASTSTSTSASASATAAKQKGTAMTYTILRPVAFYENLGGFQGKVFATAWRDVVRSRPLQIISTEDIGRVAANAFSDRSGKYAGRAISLVGDELSFEEFERVFVDVTGAGAPKTWGFMARFVLWMVEELGVMYRWFERDGYGASLEESREVLPEMMTFRAWLGEQEGKKKL